MKTIATIFSGCGGVELGAIAAGLMPIWGVDNDPKVAEIYRQNIGDHIICDNADAVNVAKLERPDILWASPPCQAYSTARTVKKRHESQDTGLDIIRYIKVLQPEMFFLENVPGFRKSEVFWEILKALGGVFRVVWCCGRCGFWRASISQKADLYCVAGACAIVSEICAYWMGFSDR